jgi:hypothetical protein
MAQKAGLTRTMRSSASTTTMPSAMCSTMWRVRLPVGEGGHRPLVAGEGQQQRADHAEKQDG